MFDKGQGERATERGKPCGKTAGHSKGAEGAMRGAVGRWVGAMRGTEGRGGGHEGPGGRAEARWSRLIFIILMYARRGSRGDRTK